MENLLDEGEALIWTTVQRNVTFEVRTVDKCARPGACDGGGLSYCEVEWQGVDEGQAGQKSVWNHRPALLKNPTLLIPC